MDGLLRLPLPQLLSGAPQLEAPLAPQPQRAPQDRGGAAQAAGRDPCCQDGLQDVREGGGYG